MYWLDWLLVAFICFGQSTDNAHLAIKDETLGTTTKIRQTARTPLYNTDKLYSLAFDC
ncbi:MULTISPECIES: hypothetical protein [unclassified Psychrobacter]|uniref:hypothetical protein n=1 Tax=unclassified Psychrobacter TaxID=196806 RepID=UPI0025F87ECA|nr:MULTISPECIES: hypothetical protein [unclassified Psychrobacter]